MNEITIMTYNPYRSITTNVKTFVVLTLNRTIIFVENDKFISVAHVNKYCTSRKYLLVKNIVYSYQSSRYKFLYRLYKNGEAEMEKIEKGEILDLSRETRIELLVNELLFSKRRKELAKAVRIYKQNRRKRLENFLPTVLCKIVEEYC